MVTTMKNSTKRKRRERGGALVEIALLSPWIFFLFVGVLDVGFYTYGAICTQNAARAAAIQTATAPGAFYQSDTLACTASLRELNLLPNVVSVNSCGALPVVVTRRTLCDSAQVSYVTCDAPGCADCTTNPKSASSQVAVQYQSIPLVPIPGILTGRLTITRIAESRIINE